MSHSTTLAQERLHRSGETGRCDRKAEARFANRNFWHNFYERTAWSPGQPRNGTLRLYATSVYTGEMFLDAVYNDLKTTPSKAAPSAR